MIEHIFQKLAPVLGEDKVTKLWLIYQTETDLEKKRELEGALHALAQKYLNENYNQNSIILPPPGKTSQKGILLGTVHYGKEPRFDYFLEPDKLLLHTCIMGATGVGKSNVGLLIAKQLLEAGIPFMVFDWKRSYRDILLAGWLSDRKLEVHTVGREPSPFSFNPLKPPAGMERELWENRMVDILCNSHFLGHGVSFLLKSTLRKITHPTISDLFAALMKTKSTGRRRQWLDSSIRAVGDLSLGSIGKVFNGGADLESLLAGNVVFELDSLHEEAKTFFIEIILAWIHQYRLNRGERETLKHVVLIEEAHHILMKRRDFQEKETVMDVVLKEIRELTEGIIVLDQHPSLISKPALGNAGTTIIMRLKHADDVRAAVDTLLLEPSQRAFIGQLETGWAIVKTADSSKPFLLKIPLIDIRKGAVNDDILKEKMEGYSSAREDIPRSDGLNPVIQPLQQPDKEDEVGYSEKLNEEEQRFLEDLLKFPYSGVVERYRRLKMSMQKGTSIKDSLESKGLIKQTRLSTGTASIASLELTQTCRKLLNPSAIEKTANSLGRLGGLEHHYWVDRISNKLACIGYNVIQECPIGLGKSVDIVAEKDGRRIALEIETGKSNTRKNIDKNLSQNFDKIVVVGTSAKELEKLMRMLSDLKGA